MTSIKGKSEDSVRKLAELSLLDPKRCVLCIIPGCYMADLCNTPEGGKYRVRFQSSTKDKGKASGGNFKHNPERARIAGQKGGSVSYRINYEKVIAMEGN